MNDKKKNENRPSFRQPSFMRSGTQHEREKLYYDNADMMRLFNVTSRTLQRWRDEGIIPFRKLGGRIYYHAQQVDDLMMVITVMKNNSMCIINKDRRNMIFLRSSCTR